MDSVEKYELIATIEHPSDPDHSVGRLTVVISHLIELAGDAGRDYVRDIARHMRAHAHEFPGAVPAAAAAERGDE